MDYIKAPVKYIKFDGDNLYEMIQFIGLAYFKINRVRPVLVYDGVKKILCFITDDNRLKYICRSYQYLVKCKYFDNYFKVFDEYEMEKYFIKEGDLNG